MSQILNPVLNERSPSVMSAQKRRQTKDANPRPAKKPSNDSDCSDKENEQSFVCPRDANDSVASDWADDVSMSMADEEAVFSQMQSAVNSQVSQQSSQQDSSGGQAGSIMSITLINFMCHANFHLDLSPRINFIIGRNGSGKSAILNGLVLGLGGRATTTNRGRSMTTFIKSGQTQARIIIKLNNGTQNSGYKFGLYGKTVTIERTINASGTSTYKIKSESNKIAADKKDVLDEIIRHYHIQIDNPICMLNQEVSRNFLNTNKPQDKYKFFMKATGLEVLKNEYAIAEETRSIASNTLKTKKRTLPDIEQDVKKLGRQVKMFETMNTNRDKLKRMNDEVEWARVREEEKKLEVEQKEFDVFENKVVVEKNRWERRAKELKELEEERNKLFEELKNLESSLQIAKREMVETKTIVGGCKVKVQERQHEVRRAEYQKEDLKKQETRFEQEIKKLEEKFRNIDEDRNRRIEKIEELETSIAKLKSEEKELAPEISKLRDQLQDANDGLDKARQQQRHFEIQMKLRNEDIERLKQTQQNNLYRFGQRVPELVQRIEEAHKNGHFLKKPLGPIGDFVSLTDQSSAVAVEACLKAYLYSFCCDNYKDMTTLQKLMHQLYGSSRMPSIICRKFKDHPHDVSQYAVRCNQYKSIHQLIKVKHPAVENILIDECSIESVLYIPDNYEAMELLMNSETVPANCSKAFTQSGSMMIPQSHRQDFKSYANRDNSARVLIKDLNAQLRDLNAELKRLNQQRIEAEKNRHLMEQQVKEAEQKLRQTQNKTNQIKNDVYNKNIELSRLNNEAEPDPVEIQTLQEELEEKRQKRIKADEDIERKKALLDEDRKNLKDAEKNFQEKRDAAEELKNRNDPLKDEYGRKNDKIDSWKSDCNGRKENVKKLESELAMKRDKLNGEIKKVEDLRNKALEKTGEPIRTSKSSNTLMKGIEELKKFISEQEKRIGNKEMIYNDYKHKSELLNRIKGDIQQLSKHMSEFKESLQTRRTGYGEFRRYCTTLVKCCFQEVLKQKGFTGFLEIYHRDKKDEDGRIINKGKSLDIKVNPKEDVQASSSYNDTRSLSGGERSYSTVAFILALWETAQFPFKILDEVDVFMDAVTRKVSIDAMIEFASLKSNKQFIFLSPLSLQELPKPELVQVFRMPEPERSQRA